MKSYLFTEEAATLVAQVSCSPELGDHLCFVNVAYNLSAPHLWTALKCCVSDLLQVFSLTLCVRMHF